MSSLRRYTIALLLTWLALGLGLLGQGMWGAAATYSFFFGAVMLSSWVSGLGPGLLSTVLGSLAADYYLIEPLHQLTFDVSRAVQLSVFASIAVLISSLNDSRRRALTAVAAARAELEDRVIERTAELAAANETLRAEVERRIRSEHNFRKLIEAAPDAILVMDADGKIVTVNSEAERMFGYPRDVVLGRDVELIVPDRFVPDHRAKRAQFADASSPRKISGDLTARRADGSELPVEIRISPLDTGGQISIVGIIRDVSDWKRAQENQQRLVFELGERVKELSALHAVGQLLNEPVDPSELLPRVVERLPLAWQYPDVAAARIATADIEARTPGFEVTPWMQRAEFAMAGGGSGVIEVVYTAPRPPAAEGPFLAEERSLLDSLAALLRAYFERLQIERHRLELAQSEAAARQAQDANAAKDRFLATLSHELRSPLNAMLGWTQMLRSGRMDGESMARGFDVLERSVRMQSKLIEDLLDVSRIIAGKFTVDKQTVDLAIVTGNAVDAAKPAARHKNVTLTSEIAPRLTMEADPQRLQQIVSNLLNNALKFTPEEGSVDVHLDRVDEHAVLVVRDSGIGISPDLLPLIFDRFQQGDRRIKGSTAGLGLGLAIVKHLVDQHGGHISAASDGPGSGSTFTVSFPLLRRDVPRPIAPSPVATRPPGL